MLIYQYIYHLQHQSGNPKSCTISSGIISPVSQRHSTQWENMPTVPHVHESVSQSNEKYLWIVHNVGTTLTLSFFIGTTAAIWIFQMENY